MSEAVYPARERRKFRRLQLNYPVRIEAISRRAGPALVAEGVTVNLSFGGALVGVVSGSGLEGAKPVTIHFADPDAIAPDATPGVVWRLESHATDEQVAVEFDSPLLAYDGASELRDRLDWLRNMGGPEFLDGIVDQFLTSAPRRIRRARDSQAVGDLEAVAQIARALKSSAGNIGAVNFYEVARRVEQAAVNGDGPTAARYVDDLEGYFRTIRRQLQVGR